MTDITPRWVLKIEVSPGRWHLRDGLREAGDGSISGSRALGDQRGHLRYRSREHYLAEVRPDPRETFSAEEVAIMDRAPCCFETREEYDAWRACEQAAAEYRGDTHTDWRDSIHEDARLEALRSYRAQE